MGILQPAKIETGYLKAGFLGFAGSGKTHTAFLMAIGLLEATGDKRPIAMVDTEAGSDWWLPRVRDAGYELMVVKSRAFADLLKVGPEAEQSCSILLVDSISHIWKELLESYQRKFNVSRLAFHHWNVIKPEWQKFTDWFLNSQIHAIVCGRAGFEYDYEEDDTGHKELVKTGVRMKAESEFGFEPSLLIEMQRIHHSAVAKDPDLKGWIHRAVILKDRSDRMNGQEIDNPTYQSFLPHMEAINLGGEHRVIDADRSSDDMFDDRDRSAIHRKRRVEITLEEIKDVFVQAGVGSRSEKDKKEMSDALREAFSTAAWSAIQNMKLEDLEDGLRTLQMRYYTPTQPLFEPLPWEEGDKEELVQEATKVTQQMVEAGFAKMVPGKPPPEEFEGKPHGPIGVSMDANIVQEKEEPDEGPEALEELDPNSKKAEFANRYEQAVQNAHPEWTDKDRLDWQQAVIKKRNRAHWGTVDYIRAISELEGGKKREEGSPED